MSALCKASCLDSDVREQDSTCGNTDDRAQLTPVNLKAVGFPYSTWLCGELNPPTDLTRDIFFFDFSFFTELQQVMGLVLQLLFVRTYSFVVHFWTRSWTYITEYKRLCYSRVCTEWDVGPVYWKDVASPVRRDWVCSWRMLDRKCQKHIWNSYIQEVYAWQQRPPERCSACLPAFLVIHYSVLDCHWLDVREQMWAGHQTRNKVFVSVK